MVQREAVAELLALPKHHPYRQEAMKHLAILQVRLKARQNTTRDLREVMMSLSPVYEEWRQKTLDEGYSEWRHKTIDEGQVEGRRSVALKMLQQQFPIETIIQLTDLSLEQIQQLQRSPQPE